MNEQVRGFNNYDADKLSQDTGLRCPEEENMTQQQFKDDADINVIMRKFGLTGHLPANLNMPQFGDFDTIDDYQSAMNLVRAADEAFMQLPAETRARFNNDPQRLIDFLDDANNREEALKLGLLQPPQERTRDAVQAIDELRATLAPPQSSGKEQK